MSSIGLLSLAGLLTGSQLYSQGKRFENHFPQSIFLYPDHSATSQMLSDLAFALAAKGHTVRVIASQLTYEGDRSSPASEMIGTVAVGEFHADRVWARQSSRQDPRLPYLLSVRGRPPRPGRRAGRCDRGQD